VGRRPEPGAAGWRAARQRPAEHAIAAHLDDAHVVRGSAASIPATFAAAVTATAISITATTATIPALATLATPAPALTTFATALTTPALALTTPAITAPAISITATAISITATTAAIPTHTTLAPASAPPQAGSAWLDARGTRSSAVPTPAGLCARPPAGRPPDVVRTAQLLGTRASGLRRRAQACSSEARARSQSCALAA
jgi:hypothetical protein